MIKQLLDQQLPSVAGDGQVLESVLHQPQPQLVVRQIIQVVHSAGHDGVFGITPG